MINIALKPDAQRPGFYILQDIRSLPESMNLRMSARPHVWRPPTDVFETEDAIIVRVEIAGMLENDFSIVLDGRYLSIRGMRSDAPIIKWKSGSGSSQPMWSYPTKYLSLRSKRSIAADFCKCGCRKCVQSRFLWRNNDFTPTGSFNPLEDTTQLIALLIE